MVMIAWIGLLSLAADASTPIVEVRGTTTCPPPAAVETALAGLTPSRDAVAAADVAELTGDSAQVVVSLRRATGELVAHKRLDANLSCAERARVAAVVIAAWEAKLATPPGDLTLAETTNTNANPSAAPVASASPQPPPVTVAVVGGRDAQRPTASVRVEPGVALHASLAGVGVAPAGAVDLAFVRPDRSFVPALAAFAVGTHATPVGLGEASWSRFGLTAAVGFRRTWHRPWIEARGGGALSLLRISGRSFPANATGTTFDPGVLVGARVGLRTWPVAWWLEAQVTFWPRGQVVYLDGAPGSATLPRAEGLVGLGASFVGAP